MKALSSVQRGKGISDETRKKWQDKLKVVLRKTEHLNDWETSFITSVEFMLAKKEDLSFQQSSTLHKIYERLDR
jgi:hypothetical protein